MDNKKKKAPVHAASKQKKRKRYSKKVRITTIVGVCVMGVLAVLCIGVGALVSNLLSGVGFQPGDTSIDPDFSLEEESGDEEPNWESAYQNAKALAELPLRKNTKHIKNYLLLGYDGMKNTGVRSDTNIILSVNDKKKTIKLISLLRDTYVSLPGRDSNGDGKDDWGKLNSAYAYGGHTMQAAMIRDNFRLEIDQYIGVNFTSLPIVVDAMGGLDIELTQREMSQIPKAGLKKVPGDAGWAPMTGSAGVHHLDGFQTLQYARIRHTDSDFQRTARQRNVITLMMGKAKTMNVGQILDVAKKALSCVDTNMSPDELLGFAGNAMSYLNYTIESDYYLPQQGDYLNKSYKGPGAVLEFKDQKKSVEALHHYIYDE